MNRVTKISPGVVYILQAHLRSRGISLVRTSDRLRLASTEEAAALAEIAGLSHDANTWDRCDTVEIPEDLLTEVRVRCTEST